MMPAQALRVLDIHRADGGSPQGKVTVVVSPAVIQLGKRLAAIVSKRPSLAACLWGEPGVGKTHAALALLRQTPCHHLSVHATIPLSALLAALPRAEQLSTWVEASLERLDQGATSEQTVAALNAWLTALSPFVLHVEDLHEASPDRLELWNRLARALKRTRGLGLIATSRIAPLEAFEAVRLEGLDAEGSKALLEAEAGSSLPREATVWIFEFTRGNPLFALETFRHLARHGHLWNDARRWRWNAPKAGVMPASVEAVIGEVIEAALDSEDARAALNARAMLGLEITETLWAATSGLSLVSLEAAREDLEWRGVLRNAQFVHPLFREVARQSLEPDVRRDIARRAIRALESDPLTAAEFVGEAELSLQTARSLLERALKAAQTANDHRQIADLLVKLTAFSDEAERGRALFEASRAVTSFQLVEGERLAALACQTEPGNADFAVWHARLLISLNRVPEAQDLIEHLPDRIMSQTTRLLTMIELKGLRNPQWILEVWDANPEVRAQANAAARRQVANALYELGRIAEARFAFENVLKIPNLPVYERVGILNVLAMMERGEGAFEEAETTFSSALEVIEQNAAPPGVTRLTPLQVAAWKATIYTNRSVARRRELDLYRATEDMEAALALFVQVGSPRLYGTAQVGLAELLTHLGEHKRAETLLLEAQTILEPASSEGVSAMVNLSRLYLDWDAPYAHLLALKHARDAERQARMVSDLDARIAALHTAGWAEALHGQPARALEFAQSLEAISKDVQQTHARVLSLWVCGLAFERMGQPSEAMRAIREASALAKESRVDLLETERIGLDLDRMTKDTASVRKRTERAQACGHLNLVHLAHRYFSDLESTPNVAPEERVTNRAWLEVLGPIQVNSEPISERIRKGKELLALLLEARVTGHHDVPQLELLDALYPDLIEQRATGALRQLVFRMRAILGPDAILRSAGGYALGTVDTDVERFLETRDPGLWRGAYLQGVTLSWNSSLRESLHNALREAMTERLELDPHEVARLGRIVLESDPYDRDALALTLRALHTVSDEVGLRRLYKRSRAHFEEIGSPLPEDWTALLEESSSVRT